MGNFSWVILRWLLLDVLDSLSPWLVLCLSNARLSFPVTEEEQLSNMAPPIFKCFPQSPHYHDVRSTPEVVKQAFTEACNGKEYMSVADVISYMNRAQGDDHMTEAQAEALLGKLKDGSDHHLHNLFHHHKKGGTANGGLDLAGFVKLLLSPDVNSILKPKEKVRVCRVLISPWWPNVVWTHDFDRRCVHSHSNSNTFWFASFFKCYWVSTAMLSSLVDE